jgi:hypothetical protein
MSAREWRLDELFTMFPDVSRGTRRVLRCLAPARGQGSWIRAKQGVREHASVELRAEPSDEFLLRCLQEWPSSPAEEVAGLEQALLLGILEGAIRCDDPPWRCLLECAQVAFSPGPNAAIAVRFAAANAVDSLLRDGRWEAVGGPGDHVA